MSDFIMVVAVLFGNVINFLMGVTVPAIGISFFHLAIGIFAFNMFVSAFHTLFEFQSSVNEHIEFQEAVKDTKMKRWKKEAEKGWKARDKERKKFMKGHKKALDKKYKNMKKGIY